MIEAEVNGNTDEDSKTDFTVAVISSLEFERINTTGSNPDKPLDNNPGNGVPNTNVGQRIYPDKNTSGTEPDRSILRVKATVTPANVLNLRVYFASYDLDDPSANGPPIDTATNPSDGNDNNGAVNNSKSGELQNPGGGNCAGQTIALDVSRIDCPVANNTSSTNYKVTMQPGDNFAVAASLDETYRNNINVNPMAGANLINNANQIIPTSGGTNPNNVRGIRTEMLTVWRRLYIEVDSMSNVPSRTNQNANNVTGTIAQTITIPANSIRNVNVNTNPSLELNRFSPGRIEISGNIFFTSSNTTNSLEIINPNSQNITITQGSNFTLFDDDDYNYNDTVIANGQITVFNVDGDDNEAIMQLADSFIYLQDADGIGQNLYASAYIRPEYDWAASPAVNYNQTNVSFDLNVQSDNTNTDALTTALTTNRNSRNDESSDFWIAYFLLGYQGNTYEDADGCMPNQQTQQCQTDQNNNILPELGNPGISKRLVGTVASCDCYRDPTQPNQPVTCPATTPAPFTCTQLPTGAFGSLLYQEVQQDVRRSWLIAGQMVQNIQTTAPHELGHQFGLSGDVIRTTFGIMDYSQLPMMNPNTLHPEHINIIRRRVNSPGQ